MEFIDCKMLIAAVRREQYPPSDLPEIALAGRSNVGKSSLVNTLVNRKNIARTSSTPGKTATINFYEVEKKLRYVDLPGYGYAKVSKVEKQKWGNMIEGYLSKRENLKGVFLLVDARHKPTADDKMMFDWVKSFGYEPIVIATKLDKLKKSEIEKNLTEIYNFLELDYDSVLIPFSAQTRQGREEVLDAIDMILNSGENNASSPE